MISTSALKDRALAISTICCFETGKRFNIIVGSIWILRRLSIAIASAFIFFSFRAPKAVRGSRPMKIFAETDKAGIRFSSW
jgi:hypothetical protein